MAALTDEQTAALEQVKEMAIKIEATIGESLNLQANGGWAIRNNMIELNKLIEIVLPTPEPEEVVEEVDPTKPIQPEPQEFPEA